MTPTFTNVDGTDYKLDDFIVKGAQDTMVTCQKLDEDGQSTDFCYWFNAFGEIPAGWCEDAAGLVPASVTLKPGEGLIVQSQEADVSLQSSGQVSTDSQTITIGRAFKLIGNNTPITIDTLDKIVVNGAQDTMVTCQKLDAEGQSTDFCYWFNAFGEIPAGWCEDAAGLVPASVSLAPGESLIVQSQEDGVTITIPGTTL